LSLFGGETGEVMVIQSASDVINKEVTLCLHCHQRVKSGEKCVMYTSNLVRKIGKKFHGHIVYHERCYIESELGYMTKFIMP